MTAYEIIGKKRDGKKLSAEEIKYFIDGYTGSDIPDYQMSALLMAIFLKGMDAEETMELTRVMLYSGEVIDLGDIPGVKIDKHSTGGVGDKLSLILAPIVAAAGVPVPMISGRGLGHTGGTLDKLESIPGFKIDFGIDDYRKIIEDINVCLIGQTKEIAPADKKIYALRDVTATVQSIPLITASIMSKKMAEGIDALVLDIKMGRGAFMSDEKQAIALAQSLVRVGEMFNKPTIGLLTDMNTPLGNRVGNWLEIEETIDCLKGNGPEDVMEITYALAGTMICLGEKASSTEEGMRIARQTISSGLAFEKFRDIVIRQKGDISAIDHPEKYPRAKYQIQVTASEGGVISAIDALEVGMLSVELGAGRLKAEDPVDAEAGVIIHRHLGADISPGETIAEIRTNKSSGHEDLKKRLQSAFTIAQDKEDRNPLILKKITSSGVEIWSEKKN